MTPTPLQYALVALAGMAAGLVNAIAGGGTLMSFPALTAIGMPAIAANVTNTVALWPGMVGGVMAQRRDFDGQRGAPVAHAADRRARRHRRRHPAPPDRRARVPHAGAVPDPDGGGPARGAGPAARLARRTRRAPRAPGVAAPARRARRRRRDLRRLFRRRARRDPARRARPGARRDADAPERPQAGHRPGGEPGGGDLLPVLGRGGVAGGARHGRRRDRRRHDRRPPRRPDQAGDPARDRRHRGGDRRRGLSDQGRSAAAQRRVRVIQSVAPSMPTASSIQAVAHSQAGSRNSVAIVAASDGPSTR